MPPEVIPLYVTAIANFCLGLIVLVRSYRKLYGWFFMAAVLGAVMWGIGDALILTADSQSVLSVARILFYVGPMAIPACMWFFTLSFPERKPSALHTLFGITVFVGAAMAVVIWPQGLVSNIVMEPLKNSITVNVAGFTVYAAYFSLMFTLSYIALLRLYASNKNELLRTQVVHVLIGLLLASVPALVTNLGLPIIGRNGFIWLGPVFSSAFVIAVTISIVRYRLFDIRLIIARTIGYGFSIVVIAVVYGFLVFGSARLLFDMHMSIAVQIIMSVITGAAGLIFFRMQRSFDRLTSRIFYQDAYDTERLFDDLNTVLVSSLKLDYVLRKTADLLVRHMHLRFVSFVIEDGEGRVRIIGSEKHGITQELMAEITAKDQHLRGAAIVTDFLEDGQNSALRQHLDNHKIAVIVPLYSSIRRRKKSIGYMVMGAKQSGSFYDNLDLRVVETVANELVIATQNALHFEEIQNFNVTLQTKVDDATRQLRQTNHKLQQLDETKDDFISMASHQLRTPLTSVKGYISIVLEGDAGELSASQRKMLQQSYVSSQRMVYLIADLLNASRLKTGKFVIDAKPTDLAALLREEVEQLKEAAAMRSIQLEVDIPDTFPKLMLDETKTRQVIMNFLDNAIYYTPTGGRIVAKLIDKSGTVELQVVDNGIGVPRNEQHRLFSKFYRAKNAQRARPDGTGLGLFMAKKVIVAQGGSIIFDSHEGKGSTFGFALTKSKLEVAA